VRVKGADAETDPSVAIGAFGTRLGGPARVNSFGKFFLSPAELTAVRDDRQPRQQELREMRKSLLAAHFCIFCIFRIAPACRSSAQAAAAVWLFSGCDCAPRRDHRLWDH
jgi:hypothetical protein